MLPAPKAMEAFVAEHNEQEVPSGATPEGPQSESAGESETAAPLEPVALKARLDKVTAELEESQRRARETQARLVEEHDRLLRNAADFENYKKRAQKEKDDLRKFGSESMLKDFLPIADNLDRALDHADSADPKTVIEGVKLVQKLFETTLQRFGVQIFSALGKQFDPNLHEAMMQIESDEPAGTVVQEMAKGYKLHERLMRPAAVVVSKARAEAAEPSAVEPPQA